MNTREMAKKLGRKGGLARAKNLSAERRRSIASRGGQIKSLSYKANDRIESNFRFSESLKLLRPCPKVKSVSRVNYALPGVYADSK